MAEYIERESLLNLIQKEKLEATELCVPTECKKDFKAGLYRAEKIIKQVPTADVVEVVRCGQCKYYDCGICNKHHIWIGDLNFCSYGERRDT